MNAPVQTRILVPKPAAQVTHVATGMLQRACACGKHTNGEGECAECKQKREATVQRLPTSRTQGYDAPRDEPSRRFGSAARGFYLGNAPTRAPSGRAVKKLTINQPGDPYEVEADRIANQVMRMRESSPVNTSYARVQRLATPSSEPPWTDPSLQDSRPVSQGDQARGKGQAERGGSGVGQADADPTTELTSGGAPLSRSLQDFYESRFGYDLSRVRIHSGAQAERLGDAFHARAFTYQNHVWLGAGERPEPSFCLAHELVHTIQQTGSARLDSHARRAGEPMYQDLLQPPETLVQRAEKDVYWLPRAEYFSGKGGNTGKKIQDRLYADFGHASGLRQEVNIPNAARKKGLGASGAESGLGVTFGIADLYLADGNRPIGLYFTAEGPKDLRQPTRLGGIKAPKVKQRKNLDTEIDDIEKAPKWVRIGEVKAASAAAIQLGKEQVREYIKGVKTALKWTNVWAGAKGLKPWALTDDKIEPLKPEDFKIPADYTFKEGSPRADEELVLDTVREDKTNRRPLMDPREDIGQRIMGGLYTNHYEEGVWAYYARPANPDTVLQLPGLTDPQAAHIQIAQAIQNEVVNPTTGAPIQPMGLHKSGSPMSPAPKPDAPSRTESSPHSAPTQIQRAVKEAPRVRDTFNLAQVTAARKRLHGQVKGQEKTGSLKKLRFVELAYEAQEGLDQAGLARGKRLPDKDKLTVTLESKQAKPGGQKAQHPLAKLYGWIHLWTHPAIDILARFRKIFGTTFVTVSEKLRGFKEALGNKLSTLFDSHAGSRASGTSYGAVAIRALGRGLVAVGKILIPQTLRLIVESLIEGAKERLIQALPLDVDRLEAAVTDNFKEFETIITKVEEIKTNVETHIADIKESLGKYVTGFAEILDKASTIATTVKWAVRAAQCATPPGWGCLKLLLSSLTAWVAEKVLQNCSLQREVACLLTGIEFVKTGIPKAIANAVGDLFNGLLSKIYPPLSPLFKKLEYVPPLDCNEVGCDGKMSEWDIAYMRLESDLIKKHGTLGAAMMMDALLEMTRAFGTDESAGMTAAEVEQLRKMLLLYEVSPFELQQIVERVKQHIKEGGELRAATVEELAQEIERQRAEMEAGLTGESKPGGGGEGGTESEGGGEGGAADTAGGGGGESGGEEAGVATVDMDRATFNGKRIATLERSLTLVENPDLGTHTKGSHKVTLVTQIDGVPVRRVTNVPVYIPSRVWRDSGKTKMTIIYRLLKGVRFDHHVPSIPSPVILEKGAEIPMTVKNPHRAPASKAQTKTKAQKK